MTCGDPFSVPLATLHNRQVTLTYEWRGEFDNAELNSLHAEGFGDDVSLDWNAKVHRHSLGWVCARGQGELVGFVNVAWDGGAHAFLLDTVVAGEFRRAGVGTRMIAIGVDQAKAAGCDWLHVDFDEPLAPFYLRAAGFSTTRAGLIDLTTRAFAAPDS